MGAECLDRMLTVTSANYVRQYEQPPPLPPQELWDFRVKMTKSLFSFD